MCYFNHVKESIEKFYQNDSSLLERRGSMEWAVNFRIAHYLSMALEPSHNGFFIDCEFNRNNNSAKELHGNEGSYKVRPDIIFHDRGSENKFVIEIKLCDDIDIIRNDIKKIHDMMNELRYSYGYMISGMLSNDHGTFVNRKKVVIHEFKLRDLGSSSNGERHEYRYCEDSRSLQED